MSRYTGFVGPSATARSKIACDDRTVNLFIEKTGVTGKAPYALYRTPGYRIWCDLGVSDPVRAVYTLNGAAYAIAGTKLYELPSVRGGSAVERASGLANPDDAPAVMASSGEGSFQMVIAAGSMLYNFDFPTSTLTVIPDVAPSQVLFMDATFFALDPTLSTLYASATEDGSSWDPGDVAQRESAADKIMAMARVGTELWTFGSQTTSVLYDSGAADFPLTPNPNVFIQRGILAPWTLCVADNAPYWLGQGVDGGGTVYRGQGYAAQPISTDAVEYAISQMSTVLDAEAFVYQEGGNQFYVLLFPTAQQTWVYDITEGLWHERGEWNGLDYDCLPIRGQVFAFNANLVGSRTDGVIYEQTLDVATETDGETGIRWLRRAPHLCEELHAVGYDWFQLDMQVGVGLSTTVATDADPFCYVRWSNNGGQSWSNVYGMALGPVGAYGTRVIRRNMGAARDRVYEVFGAAKVVTALVDAYLTIRPGTS